MREVVHGARGAEEREPTGDPKDLGRDAQGPAHTTESLSRGAHTGEPGGAPQAAPTARAAGEASDARARGATKAQARTAPARPEHQELEEDRDEVRAGPT